MSESERTTPSNGDKQQVACNKLLYPRNAPETTSQTKLSWEEQKKRDSERRKIEREVERLEKEIEELEDKKSALEAKMSEPSVYSNGEKAKAVQTQINELANQIEQKTMEWETASEKLID